MTHLTQISHVVIGRLLIAYNLKLALVPCATSEWPKELRSFHITLYPHAVFCLESFANETQLSYYTKDADIIGLPGYRWCILFEKLIHLDDSTTSGSRGRSRLLHSRSNGYFTTTI